MRNAKHRLCSGLCPAKKKNTEFRRRRDFVPVSSEAPTHEHVRRAALCASTICTNVLRTCTCTSYVAAPSRHSQKYTMQCTYGVDNQIDSRLDEAFFLSFFFFLLFFSRALRFTAALFLFLLSLESFPGSDGAVATTRGTAALNQYPYHFLPPLPKSQDSHYQSIAPEQLSK